MFTVSRIGLNIGRFYGQKIAMKGDTLTERFYIVNHKWNQKKNASSFEFQTQVRINESV